jgi:hypothetical protein
MGDKCKRCGYETEQCKKYDGLCYQCWLDKDCPSQDELETMY